MELTKLEFAVNTEQLKEAVDLLGKVQAGTAALGDAEGRRAPKRKKLTDEEIAAAKAAKEAADAAKKAATGQKKLGEEGEATANKLSKLQDQLRFLRGELVQGETGFTKMQAGVMAAAKAAGVSNDVLREYATTFDSFNRITGQNPFDKSVGGLKSLDSELNRLQKTTELANQGFKLTQNQIKALAQDTEALTQVNKARGVSEDEINKILAEHTKQFGVKATQLNDQIERSKELEKQTKNEALARVKAQEIENKARLDSQALWKKQLSEFAGGGAAYKETMGSMKEFYAAQNQELSKSNSDNYWKQEFKNLTEGKLGYKEAMISMADYYKQQERESKKSSGSTVEKANLKMMDDALKLYRQSEVDKARALQQRMQLETTAGNAMVDLFYKNEQKKKQAFEARMKAEATMMNQTVALFYKSQNSSSGSTAVKVNRELAQSTKWVANEEAKMLSVLNSLNVSQSESNSLNEKAARSIANYERNLRQAGVTGADAAKKLALYREQQAQIQTIEQRNQGKFLSRALQPQIGDVAVSLAAGQNPLTVLLQQGDQIRGLIAQSGIEGAALQKIMRDAFSSTITSIKDTAVAMGSVLGGAFITLGKNIAGVVTGPIAAFKAASEAGATATGSFTAAINAMNVAFLRLIGNPVVATIAAITAVLTLFAVATYKSVTQQSELNKALALNSSAFKMSTGEAIDYAQSLATSGESSSKYVDIITIMAKAGYKAGDNFKLVADSAINMEKYAGIAVDETIKKFADLAKEPLEGVIKLAQETGRVPAEIIKLVAELERQGKVAEAAGIATQAMADVNSQVVNQIAADAGYLEKTWMGTVSFLKGLWSGFKDLVLGWGVPDSTETKIKGIQKRIDEINKGRSTVTGALGLVPAKELAAKQAELEVLNKQFDAEKAIKQQSLEKEKNANRMIGYQKDIEKYAQNDLKRQNELLKVTERNNALVAAGLITRKEADQQEADIRDKLKDPKKAKTDGEKESEKQQKALNAAMEKYNDIMNISQDYNASWNDELRALDLLRKSNKITEEQYNDARAKAFEKQPYAIKYLREEVEAQNELAKAQSLINGLLDKSNGAGKAYTDTLKALNALEGNPGIDPEQLKAAKIALEETTPAAKAYAAVIAEYGKTMSDITAQRTAVSDQYSTDFKTEEQKNALASLSKYTRSITEADAQYQKDIADAQGKLTGDRLTSATEMYKNQADTRKRLAQDVYDRERYLQSEMFQLYSAGFDALKGLATDFGRTVTDEFMNFAATGKSSFENLTSSFGNMVQKMIYDLIRLRIQKQVTGLFDQLIDVGIKAVTNSFTPSNANTIIPIQPGGGYANGAAFMGGVEKFANGGAFSNSVVSKPTMFNMAEMGEAGPEAIMPLRRDSSGALGVVAQGAGGSSVEIVINNYGSDTATATETVDSRGNRKVNVTIGEMVAGELNRSGSATQKAMQSTFGQRPQLIRR